MKTLIFLLFKIVFLTMLPNDASLRAALIYTPPPMKMPGLSEALGMHLDQAGSSYIYLYPSYSTCNSN